MKFVDMNTDECLLPQSNSSSSDSEAEDDFPRIRTQNNLNQSSSSNNYCYDDIDGKILYSIFCCETFHCMAKS